MPPLLRQQVRLIENVEGPLLPRLGREALILQQRLDARLGSLACLSASLGNLQGESLQPLPFSECLLRKLEALSRCSIEMCKPIEIGSYQ